MLPDSMTEARQTLLDRVAQLGLQAHQDLILHAAQPAIYAMAAPRDPAFDSITYVKQRVPSFAGDRLAALNEWRRLIRDEAPLGSSHIGGLPDLPPGLVWPTNVLGERLQFTAQIDCASLPHVSELPLPDRGWLYFFVENSDREFPLPCSVLYFGGSVTDLARATEVRETQLAADPYGDRQLLPFYPISSFAQAGVVPEHQQEGGEPLSELDDAYTELLSVSDLALARLFGPGGFEDMTPSQVARKYGGRSGDDWLLFLKIYTRHDLEGRISWLGDNALEVYIRRSDLVRRDFSNCYATVPA